MNAQPAPTSTLLPLFRSDGQARLIAELFLHPDWSASLSDLARRVGIHPASAQREVSRLEAAGLVTSHGMGSARIVRANADSPVFDEMTGLVLKTLGPPAVVAEALRDVDGVDAAWVFGSWAARTLGERGPAPADIDLLVVGTPDRRALSAACRSAAERLRQEVQPVVVDPADWHDPGPGFVRGLKDGPLVTVPPTRG